MNDQAKQFDALILHRDDDVAVVIRDIEPGASVIAGGAKGPIVLATRQSVPAGHKLALYSLPAGALVRKYGAVIGRLAVPAVEGDHIHVHNLVSLRANGAEAAARTTTRTVSRGKPEAPPSRSESVSPKEE